MKYRKGQRQKCDPEPDKRFESALLLAAELGVRVQYDNSDESHYHNKLATVFLKRTDSTGRDAIVLLHELGHHIDFIAGNYNRRTLPDVYDVDAMAVWELRQLEEEARAWLNARELALKAGIVVDSEFSEVESSSLASYRDAMYFYRKSRRLREESKENLTSQQ